MNLMRALLLTSILAVFLPVSPVLAGDCTPTLFAELPLRLDSAGAVTVPMTVVGQTLNMLIDTGGVGAMLTPEAVKKIGGQPYSIVDGVPVSMQTQIIGYEGERVVAAVNVASIGLGATARGGPMFFYVMPGHLPPGDDGILSNDILRNYDFEFDFANSKFRMYYLGHCDGAPRALFNGPVSEVPFEPDETGHVLITTELDGTKVNAFVDTGFWHSTADWETIKSLFHLTETSPGVTAADDFGKGIATYRYPFQTLRIGDVSVQGPNIILAPRTVSNMKDRQPDFIVGIDILRHLHMYFDHRDRMLYIGPATQ